MAEMLLINPRKRRKVAKRKAVKRNVSATRKIRRRNPIGVSSVSTIRRRRRSNPIAARRAVRRRRNPISMGSLKSSNILNMLKDAAIGGAGSIAVDVAMGYAAPYLPASLRRVPGTVGVGDAVKLAATVLLGKVLSKPTKGLSEKMAKGALVCQARDVMRTFLPATMTLGQVGYASPAVVRQGTNRVGPIRQGVNAYTAPGQTPMLNAFTPGSQMLSGMHSARAREGAIR